MAQKGQCSDFSGADVLLQDLAGATAWMADKGYDNPSSG